MKMPFKLAVLLNKLHAAGCGQARREGREFRCRCPAHADNGPSLYLGLTEDAILVNCKAGCTTEAICDRLDHDLADLFFDVTEPWVQRNGECAATDTGAPPGAEELATQVAADGELRHAVYTE